MLFQRTVLNVSIVVSANFIVYKYYTIYLDYENFNNNFSKINFNSRKWYVIFESNLVFRKC